MLHLRQEFVERQHVNLIAARWRQDVAEGDAVPVAAALVGFLAASVVDQDLPHCRRSHRVEMGPVFPATSTDRELGVGLVDEGGRLQRMAALLTPEVVGRQPAQVFVNHGKELRRSRLVAISQPLEQLGWIGVRPVFHALSIPPEGISTKNSNSPEPAAKELRFVAGRTGRVLIFGAIQPPPSEQQATSNLTAMRETSPQNPIGEAPMNMPKATIGILILLGLPGWVHAEFEWRGNNNNNWDNNGNWTGQSGWPDAPNHNVLLNASANRFDLDLRGGDRDVRDLSVGPLVGIDYIIESNSGGQGVLRINRDILGALGSSPNTGSVTFANSVNLVQAADGLWSLQGIDLIFDGTLSGNSLIELYSGDVTFNAANSFSGELLVYPSSRGITLGHANAVANALVTVNRNMGLNVTDNAIDANVGALAGTANLNFGSQTVTVGGNDLDTVYSGDISGTGNLVKVGGGDMTLSGDNTNFTGTVTIGDGAFLLGSITIGSDNALVNNTVNVRTLDGLVMGGADRTIGGLTGNGDVHLTHSLSVGNNNSDTNFGGTFEGVGSLEKVGTGTLTVTGFSNSYSGGTALTDGILEVNRNNSLGDASGSVTFNGGTLSAIDSFTTERPFDFADASVDGALHVIAGETLQIDSEIIGASDNHLRIDGTGTLVLAGNSNGFGTLHNSGGGHLNVSGAGGKLNLSGDAANAFFVSGDSTATIQNGVTVTLTGNSGVNRTVLTGNAVLSVEGVGSTLVSPRLDVGPSGAGSAEVIVQLSGSIQSDRIRIGDIASDDGAAGTLTIGAGSDVVSDQTALLRRGTIDVLGGTFTTNTLSDVDSPNTIRISDPVSGSALTIGTNNGSSLVNAVIEDASTGSGSIRKVGTGTLELTHANTYSGDTFVDGGTLLISNSNGYATGLGDVFVSSGATFAGTGGVDSMIVNTGGVVSPGQPTGVLVAFDATFEPGATLAIAIGGLNDFSQLNAPGPVNLNGTLDLTYINGFSASPGDSFRIVDSGDLFGTFATINFPDDQPWYIKYNTNTDNVIVGICSDADSDGVCDEDDVCDGFDDNIDTDGDGLPNGCDACAGGAASGDVDGDGDVDLADYEAMSACLLGPAGGLNPDCDCFDLDDDGDVDTFDFANFQVSFTCN